MKRLACFFLLSLPLSPLMATAQANPRGPAEIISGTRQARDARDLERAGERSVSAGASAANPQGVPDAVPDADGDNPHAGLDEGAERPPIASERADGSLADGTIRVLVVDMHGKPVPNADVSIGIMASDSTHSTRETKTGADGIALVSGLAVGERQAYRVNVPYQGAKYSSTPFRLPPRGGYEVEIHRLPVTRDDRMVVLYLGATSIELKDDRLKIVQEAQLLNIGGETYAFPEEGTLVRLPKGFMAMQSQESMTDQHVAEAKGEGVRVRGSLPPGQATLLWGFDLPLAGSEASIALDIPWLTFAYRVISDAPPGMTLEVEGMPQASGHIDGGRRFLVTEMQRKVGEPPFHRLRITLRGMPGPGPARWIAAALALCAVLAGVVVARRRPDAARVGSVSDLDARQAELLARARAARALREAGESGPEYYSEQMLALTDDLAELLFEQAELKPPKKQVAQRRGSPA
jgi:hypothetical protein